MGGLNTGITQRHVERSETFLRFAHIGHVERSETSYRLWWILRSLPLPRMTHGEIASCKVPMNPNGRFVLSHTRPDLPPRLFAGSQASRLHPKRSCIAG